MSENTTGTDDPDFVKWIDIFDTALTSDSPLVKEQLSKLLMIASLVTTAGPSTPNGPFRTILTEIKSLRTGLAQANNNIQALSQQVRRENYYTKDYTWDKYSESDYAKGQLDADYIAKIRSFITKPDSTF